MKNININWLDKELQKGNLEKFNYFDLTWERQFYRTGSGGFAFYNEKNEVIILNRSYSAPEFEKWRFINSNEFENKAEVSKEPKPRPVAWIAIQHEEKPVAFPVNCIQEFEHAGVKMFIYKNYKSYTVTEITSGMAVSNDMPTIAGAKQRAIEILDENGPEKVKEAIEKCPPLATLEKFTELNAETKTELIKETEKIKSKPTPKKRTSRAKPQPKRNWFVKLILKIAAIW